MESIETIFQSVFSWPLVVLVGIFLFRSPIHKLIMRLSNSEGSSAELGPLKIELGKLASEGKDAVDSLKQLHLMMAESRLLELEIFLGGPGSFVMSEEQKAIMQKHIDELRKLTDGGN